MSISTFSKFLWAGGNPTCSCHIFYTHRRFPVCNYRHLAEEIWGCRGWQYYCLPCTVNFWGCRRKCRNCQSHVTADRTNPNYIYIERFNNISYQVTDVIYNYSCFSMFFIYIGTLFLQYPDITDAILINLLWTYYRCCFAKTFIFIASIRIALWNPLSIQINCNSIYELNKVNI
jgi:hypothetical protein